MTLLGDSMGNGAIGNRIVAAMERAEAQELRKRKLLWLLSRLGGRKEINREWGYASRGRERALMGAGCL